VIKKLLIFAIAMQGAFAVTIEFSTLPANYEFGTYNGFVMATVDGEANQALICDDFDHTTYVPSGVLVYNESSLTAFVPLQYARFNGLTEYEEAAFLLEGLQNNPSLTADYQYALWHLFTPSVAFPDTESQVLLNIAAADVAQGGNYATSLYSELEIFTPAPGYTSNQEFLQLVSPNYDPAAVPEPSPGFLIGIGLVMIGGSVATKQWLKGRRAAKV
jgi:hypothetical protein